MSSRQSLEELKPIWQTIMEIKGADLPNIPVMLAGNKCDETPEIREVSAAEGQSQAKDWGVSFMETSAKTNHNVTQLFQVSICCYLGTRNHIVSAKVSKETLPNTKCVINFNFGRHFSRWRRAEVVQIFLTFCSKYIFMINNRSFDRLSCLCSFQPNVKT